MLYQIAYVSAAAEPIDQVALKTLVRQSRKNNEERDITGLLLYKNGHFMQVLEGPKEEVKRVYAAIAEDDRHEGIVQLLGREIEERDFPGWSLAFKTEGGVEPINVQSFTPFMGEDFEPKHFTDDLSFAHQLLLDFKRTDAFSG